MLGIVELNDTQQLMDMHGMTSYRLFREATLERLKGWVRPCDEWHITEADQFCVILKNIKSDGELELAMAKLRRLFQSPHYHLGRAINLEVTAGFAPVSETEDENELLQVERQAGMALRQARKSARSYDVYSPQTAGCADRERKLLERLETALQRGEFQLYFQPKVHAAYHSLLGAEALIRWHTRDKQVLTPDEFIGVAEANAVIRPLTWWVIKAAVARLARWPEQVSLSVNIPPPLLLDDEILSVVSDALAIHVVSPERLCLEVTESVMVENPGVVLDQLGKLRATGVQISLDDFGTGYCSLAYFRDLPVDEIKIDKSFVLNMLESENDYAIVKAVIDLAHNFSMKVVAEGVESNAIASELGKLGCDILQGYVFDKPLPSDEFSTQYGLQARAGNHRSHN